MRRKAFVTVVFAAGLFSAPAHAGIYADDLSRCLVRSATTQDQVDLMKWLFSNFALNPAFTGFTSIPDDQREAVTKNAAQIMQRLTTSDCRKETVEAVKYEGRNAVEASYSVLGQVAARGIMTDPKVMSGINGLTKYTDQEKWNALFKEAGVPVPPAPAPAQPAPKP